MDIAELVKRSTNLGFKGFDKNLKCTNDFQYQIGEHYFTHDDPKLCTKGFHFCKKLEDVFKYYNRQNSRFCLVEHGNDVDTNAVGDSKTATNRITILQELSRNDIFQIVDIPKIVEDIKNSGLENYNFAIGGSVSLILNGLLKTKQIKDLDIIMDKENIDAFLKSKKPSQVEDFRTSSLSPNDKEENGSIDVDAKVDGGFYTIELIEGDPNDSTIKKLNGKEINIFNVKNIMETKERYVFKNGFDSRDFKSSGKHAVDLIMSGYYKRNF